MVVDRDIIHGETGEVFNTRFQRIRQASAVFPFRGEKREASERMPGMSTMFMTFMYVARIRQRWFQVRSCVLRIDRDIDKRMTVKCWTLQLRDGEVCLLMFGVYQGWLHFVARKLGACCGLESFCLDENLHCGFLSGR